MVTTRTFAQRCTKLALDIERNALELGDDVPMDMTRALRLMAASIIARAKRLQCLDTDLQKFMQLCPADMQAYILSTYADARELHSEQGYEIEQLQLCYAL